jgi:hypothetical protein
MMVNDQQRKPLSPIAVAYLVSDKLVPRELYDQVKERLGKSRLPA